MLFKGGGGNGNGGGGGDNGGGGDGDGPHGNRGQGYKAPNKPPCKPSLLTWVYNYWKKNKQKFDNMRGCKINVPKVEGAKIQKSQQYASKKAQHNYKHYFAPDVKINGKNKLHISGFHLNYNGMFKRIVDLKDIKNYKHGFYTAYWKYSNSGYKFSSFWPDKWPYKKVLKKICEAYCNQIQKPIWENGTIIVKGRIKEGYDVVIVYEANQITRLATGKIITAYPILKK